MKKKRHSEEQIIGVLKQMGVSQNVMVFAREPDVSEGTHREKQVRRAGSDETRRLEALKTRTGA